MHRNTPRLSSTDVPAINVPYYVGQYTIVIVSSYLYLLFQLVLHQYGGMMIEYQMRIRDTGRTSSKKILG